MTVSEFIRGNFDKYEKMELIQRCADVTGRSRKHAFSEYWREFKKRNNAVNSVETVPKEIKVGLSEAELREKHDLSFIIQKAVDALQDGIYLTDMEFVNKHLKGQSGYRQLLDNFREYRGKAGGVTYWSSKKSIHKMRMEGVLT